MTTPTPPPSEPPRERRRTGGNCRRAAPRSSGLRARVPSARGGRSEGRDLRRHVEDRYLATYAYRIRFGLVAVHSLQKPTFILIRSAEKDQQGRMH